MGLILEKIKLKGNSIYFIRVPDRLLKVLSNNGFLNVVSNNSLYYESTYILYKSFEIKEKDRFEQYLIDELDRFLNNNEFKYYTKPLVRAISEMFVNVKMHTSSNKVMTCGYYLPEKKELYFTISNHGITIRKNIEIINNYIFDTDIDAINWAVKRSMSTRKYGESGGLGFYTSREFISKYNGVLYIISGRGYWTETNKVISASEMNSAFPGTVITFKIQLINESKCNDIKKEIIGISEILGGELWSV